MIVVYWFGSVRARLVYKIGLDWIMSLGFDINYIIIIFLKKLMTTHQNMGQFFYYNNNNVRNTKFESQK